VRTGGADEESFAADARWNHFEKYTKTTRRAQFLAEMDRVMPWRELCARIEPV
jgi:hypothetical protein